MSKLEAKRAPETKDGVARCPTGCGFDALEIGVEHESFMALAGEPYQLVKCGSCGFQADGPVVGRTAAIDEWNKAAIAKAEGRER